MEERLTTDEVAKLFKLSSSTLRVWRTKRRYDKRYPRYHKLHGKVYYVRNEVEEDLKGVCI